MNRNDINRIFTEKVSELLAQGYQIHTSTMGGSQGEVAHIDLAKGSEMLRVLVDREYKSSEIFSEYFTIKVGRNTERIGNSWCETVWNTRLEVLSEIRLVKVTDTYFTTPEDAQAMGKKNIDRWKARECSTSTEVSDAYKSVALRYIRHQPRMKTTKLSDIESMVRRTDSNGRIRYEIKVKGNRITLPTTHN